MLSTAEWRKTISRETQGELSQVFEKLVSQGFPIDCDMLLLLLSIERAIEDVVHCVGIRNKVSAVLHKLCVLRIFEQRDESGDDR